MDLNQMLVFARVVQAGSFSAAAKALGMPKSTVSRKVSELEERLDARLLQRTTRKLNLTDVGRTYYDHAARIAGEIEVAERAVSSQQDTPRGLLRVTAPINIGWLAAIVSGYLQRYPEVRLDLYCTGRRVDLVEEGYDLAIRAGVLADSTMIARSLGSAAFFLVATPAYLKKHGRPRAPADLTGHDCLLFRPESVSAANLRLVRGDESAEIALAPRMQVGDMDVMADATKAGLGIGQLPAFQCIDDLRARRLERVLRDWSFPPIPIHVVYPSTRHISPKVKSFVDHLQAGMTPPPWELGPMP